MSDEDRLHRALLRPAGGSSDYDLNPDLKLPLDRILCPAAVLLAIWPHPAGPRLILTKRASHLKHHPGQIAFPGGKVDPGDVSSQSAALREASEEVGLAPDNVQIIGSLPSHETVTGFTVQPFLGVVRADFIPIPEVGEVEEVFTVPLSHVLDMNRFVVERRLWLGQWRSYYAVPYGPYYIWGATARILRGLAEQAQP